MLHANRQTGTRPAAAPPPAERGYRARFPLFMAYLLSSVVLKALSLPLYCECVASFLSEDRTPHLSTMREYSRGISPTDRTLRGHGVLATTAGFVTNSVPGIHLLWGSRKRYVKRLLGKLHMLCWAVGFKANCDVQEPEDFLRVLLRWTREADHGLCHRDVPSANEVVARVSERLRTAHLKVLTTGFLPIVGPVVGLVIEGSLITRFRVCAEEFYESPSLTHERSLPEGHVTTLSQSAGRFGERQLSLSYEICVDNFLVKNTSDEYMGLVRATAPITRSQSAGRFGERQLSLSYEICVDNFLVKNTSDLLLDFHHVPFGLVVGEHAKVGSTDCAVRATAPITRSRKMARLLSGSSGMLGSWIPGFHVCLDSHQVSMFLESLQAICWSGGEQHGCESHHGKDFRRVLWQWASKRSEWSQNERGEFDQDDSQELVAAVSAKLRKASQWKLAFGFLPMIGPIAAFLIHGSMGARFYDATRAYFAAHYSGRA